jgi:galactofuranosylgalactofuranosylrhamnosyl-N-acetylglucosaminyl-diphospho-decaprenol beta-1,5/1,6-galactofuranosyltransferase
MTDFVLQRIDIPDGVAKEPLYFYREPLEDYTDLGQTHKTRLNFCSFFNAFFENYYVRHTTVTEVRLNLRIVGKADICVFRLRADRDRNIHREELTACQTGATDGSISEFHFEITLASHDTESPGILGFTIGASDSSWSLLSGNWSTPNPPQREVRLATITTTFKREAYLSSTIQRILDDGEVLERLRRMIIVDNGRTLANDLFAGADKVTVIPQDNFGGSGGTTRGLIEAFLDQDVTHVLIMDDDIELDTSSIFTTFSVFSYAKTEFAIAGTMLNALKPDTVYEAGAIFGDRNFLSITALKSGEQATRGMEFTASFLAEDDETEYGAWWFCAFPKDVLASIGFPMPYFIISDDIEFGLRMKSSGVRSIPFPGIGVWHFPFHARPHLWMPYYIVRNQLITALIRRDDFGRLSLLRDTLRFVLRWALRYDYVAIELAQQGLKAVRKGPLAFLERRAPERHQELSRWFHQALPPAAALSTDRCESINGSKSGSRMAILLTLNGHLLDLLKRGEDKSQICLKPADFKPLNVYGHKTVRVLGPGTEVRQYTRSLRSFVSSMLPLLWTLTAITISFGSIRRKWQTEDLTSMTFWKRYLGLGQ